MFKGGDRVRFIGDQTGRGFLDELIGWVGEMEEYSTHERSLRTVRTATRTVSMPVDCWALAAPDAPWGLPSAPEEAWSRQKAHNDVSWRLEAYIRGVHSRRSQPGMQSGVSFVRAMREVRARMEELDREYAKPRSEDAQ